MPTLVGPKFMIFLAVSAELVALTGVAVPETWMQGPGRVVSFIGLGYVGYAVLTLLLHVAAWLLTVVDATQSRDDLEGEDSEDS